jgi:hypothetical protein
VNRDWI